MNSPLLSFGLRLLKPGLVAAVAVTLSPALVAQSTAPAKPSSLLKEIGDVERSTRIRRVQLLPGGVTVAVDPRTKRIRMATPEELRSMLAEQAALFSLPDEELTVFRYKSGAKSVRLPASFMERTVATRSADGSISFNCASEREREARRRSAQQVGSAANPLPTALEER